MPLNYDDPQYRENVSKGKRRADIKRFMYEDNSPKPDKHFCCAHNDGKGAYLPVEQFGTRKLKTKSGIIRESYRSECKKCDAARARRYKERQMKENAEDFKERRKKAYRKYFENNYEKVLETQRMSKIAKRRAKQVETKIEHSRQEIADDPKLPLQPLIEALNERGVRTTDISLVSGMPESAVRRWRRGKNNNNDPTDVIPLIYADKLAFGADLQLWEVWPDLAA